MRQTLPFLILLLFCSCGQQDQQETITQNKVANSIDNIKTADSAKKNVGQQRPSTIDLVGWKKQQDSLRKEILKRKENTTLKESLLQELYIRDVARTDGDSLFIKLPFDLHGMDCIAPDCYRTDVSFGFKLGDTLRFPKQMQFHEHEYGCVGNETRIAGFFQLKEQDTNYVIYHSAKYNRTLVLFKKMEKGTYAYYFTKVGPGRINGKNVYTITDNYNEEDENSIYPYTSTIFIREYGNFIR